MSKSDDTRAMREARYEAFRARAAKPAATLEPPPHVPHRAEKAEAVPAPTPADPGLCGHRAISGRTCTRDQGHAAKSHRYA
jgi:hypothetical protein